MKMRTRLLRGIVGIEAAIVLIAFVVVAAALAFVALNMGFYTTQRSKEVMSQGLAQASSSLEVDGTVLAYVDTSIHNLTCAVIPVRLSAGQKDVDLTPGKADIAAWVINKLGGTNLYINTTQQAVTNLTKAIIDNLGKTGTYSYNITNLCMLAGHVTNGVAVVWSPNNNGDTVLQPGEKVLVVVNFTKLAEDLGYTSIKGLNPYDVFKVEIKPPIGAALTVERTVPASLAYSVIDLG
ncbi:MAG: archaellin/type IV pilin N-terminal domain-containing protein [Ignisphaera sp.]